MNAKLSRPTKKAILDDLNTYDTGIKNSQGEFLKLPTIVSFLTYKQALPSNDKIVEALGKSAKPNKILDWSKADLSFDPAWVTSNLSQPLKSNYMFLGLNFSYREIYDLTDYNSFHMSRSKSIKNNVKGFVFLNVLTNDSLFEESYITDVLKNVLVTDSSQVSRRFYTGVKRKSLVKTPLDELVSQEMTYLGMGEEQAERILSVDRETYVKSAKILQHECELIQPKQLIAFGADAENAVKKMANDGLLTGEVAKLASECVRTYHYATPLSFEHAMELKDVLLRKIK